MSLKNERQRIEWRRNKVLELSSQCHSQPEISRVLQVSVGTVNKDIQYLRRQAHENLQKHIQHTLPEEYQNCITGMKQVLRLSWQIANNGRQNNQGYNESDSNMVTTGDDRTRLQALSLINDCYKYIIDLTTNGVIITDAIKFVQTNKEKMTMIKRGGDKESEELDHDKDKDQLEEKQEKETGEKNQETTNRVF